MRNYIIDRAAIQGQDMAYPTVGFKVGRKYPGGPEKFDAEYRTSQPQQDAQEDCDSGKGNDSGTTGLRSCFESMFQFAGWLVPSFPPFQASKPRAFEAS